mgnify:CR=1 FL=1
MSDVTFVPKKAVIVMDKGANTRPMLKRNCAAEKYIPRWWLGAI